MKITQSGVDSQIADLVLVLQRQRETISAVTLQGLYDGLTGFKPDGFKVLTAYRRAYIVGRNLSGKQI